mgnify:CR=1 FL=1
MLVFMLCLSVAGNVYAGTGYFEQLGHTFSRGFKNAISCLWEIPYTISQYDQQTGNSRVFRDTAGFFDGILRTVTRLGSGAWDMMVSVIPGDQDGITLKPETFF